MPSRRGSPNKDKAALRDMAEMHGVDVIEMRMLLLKDCFKTIENEIGKPRSRRSKQYLKAEELAHKHLEALTPYLHGKLANVTVDAEVLHIPTVIRAPETISVTQEWLAKYGPPKDAVNEPPGLPFANSLKKSLDTAEALGIDDPAEIVEDARKDAADDEDVFTRTNRKYLKGYD